MNFKTAAAVGLSFGVLGVGSAFATFARVESMGKNTTYIMDDVSIFDNAANINLYPNYLIGEFGPYTQDVKTGTNMDPQHPNFGGIFSLSLGDENNPDPRLSIGGLFGRINNELMRYFPTKVVGESSGDTTAVPETVTNFDGFLGGTLSNGDAWGLHIYIAHQDGGDKTDGGDYQVEHDAYASAVQADGGLNLQFGSNIDFEFSFGLARIQYGPEHLNFFDDGDFSFLAKSRAFFTLDALDGELVPAFSMRLIQAPGIEDDFVWNKLKAHDWYYDYETGESTYDSQGSEHPNWDKRTDIGGMITFGIERNIWWDWFVIRVGGQKSILYTQCDVNAKNKSGQGICREDGNFFSTNPLADGTADDHVGFGFGINIEEKLKIDVTVAEDLLFRNPFQGEGRIFSRISATYSF